MRQAVRTLIREEGVHSLWRGNTAAMGLWIGFSGVQFPCYHFVARTITGASPDAAIRHHALIPLIAGGVSACVATGVTYPLDFIRTRMAAQGVPRVYATTSSLIVSVWRARGLPGFFQGLAPTLLQVAPNAAAMFLFYDRSVALFDAVHGAAPQLLTAARAMAVGVRGSTRHSDSIVGERSSTRHNNYSGGGDAVSSMSTSRGVNIEMLPRHDAASTDRSDGGYPGADSSDFDDGRRRAQRAPTVDHLDARTQQGHASCRSDIDSRNFGNAAAQVIPRRTDLPVHVPLLRQQEYYSQEQQRHVAPTNSIASSEHTSLHAIRGSPRSADTQHIVSIRSTSAFSIATSDAQSHSLSNSLDSPRTSVQSSSSPSLPNDATRSVQSSSSAPSHTHAHHRLRSVVCGALAGTLAKLLTYPLDTVKKRLQTAGMPRHSVYGAQRAYKGSWDALVTIAREEGVARGLYKGTAPSLWKAAIGAAATFWAYEWAAELLSGESNPLMV